MSEPSLGKLLPNLKVTLDSDNAESSFINIDSSLPSDSNIEIVRPNMELFQKPKIYKNKDGAFATGIDLLAQELSGVLDKRAERFCIEKEDMKPSISSLYESMGIFLTERNSVKMKNIRLDALHMRGIEELNTDDVFNYFRDYGPESIEWINDCSCNIRWIDESSCARALLGLSNPFPIASTLEDSENKVKSSSETDDKMEVDNPTFEPPPPEIPIPPGNWRIGVEHYKAKSILLRFATKDDKKLPGAEKRSSFYKKYGNPNYGGLKGLISSSRKHKSQTAANRTIIAQKSSSSRTSFSNPQSAIVSSSKKANDKKPIKMRMYADIEEEKIKKKRLKRNVSESNVRDRLDIKYTREQLYDIRPYQDYKEDNYQKSEFDLREKLRQKRKNSTNSSNYNYDMYRNNVYCNRGDDLKKEKSVYKRKYRSPLCDDSDETDSSTHS